MICPRLGNLPPPPAEKTGWPWTIETPPLEGIEQKAAWPKVSIVTPSYMQGLFLEETIRSVLLQGYPNLEFILMDGGSTDESLDIIKKYEPWLAFWASEKDKSQAHAINKGLSRCTGEFFAYLNSDDVFCLGAIQRMAREFATHPEVSWISGSVIFCRSLDDILEIKPPTAFTLAESIGRRPKVGINQPSTFWRRCLFDKTGPFDENLHHILDSELIARSMMAGFRCHFIEDPIAYYRLHASSKTVALSHLSLQESWEFLRRIRAKLSPQEVAEATHWLTVFEIHLFTETVYRLLLARRRSDALQYLLKRVWLIPKLPKWKLYFGALFRVVITGKPPAWFRSHPTPR